MNINLSLRQLKSALATTTHLDNSGFSSLLDVFRWAGALQVVTTHAVWRIFTPPSLSDDGYLFTGLAYLLTFGPQALIIFFVMSGYLIGGSGILAWQKNKFGLKHYLIARVSRFYAVLPAVLLLTWLFDAVAIHIAGGQGFHANPEYNNYDLASVLGNALMLQAVVVPTFGSNSPLWSLAYEFWFYIVFAMLLLMASARRGQWLWVIFLAGLTYLFGWDWAFYFVFWLLGAVAAILKNKVCSDNVRKLIAVAFVLAIPLSRVADNAFGHFAGYLLLAVMTALLLWAVKTSVIRPAAKTHGFNSAMAAMSYSLYAIHYPVLLLVFTIAGYPKEPGGYGILLPYNQSSINLLIVSVTSAFLVAFALYWCTERNTPAFRRWLTKISSGPDG